MKVTRRDYSIFVEQDFLHDLDNIQVSELMMETDDTNEKYDIFHRHIHTVLDKYAPLKKLSRNQTKQLYKPWMTKGMKKSIKLKNLYRKNFMKTYNQSWYTKYKKYRDKFNSIIHLCKTIHYKLYFHNVGDNSRKIWDGINEIISKRKLKQSPINIINNLYLANH